jgi:hypothetical protein
MFNSSHMCVSDSIVLGSSVRRVLIFLGLIICLLVRFHRRRQLEILFCQ